jgi:uncharacterized protein YkwD
VLTGAPQGHQVDVRGTPGPGRGRPRRTRYLWCGLLLVPALVVGGLYLTSSPGPATSSPAQAARGLTPGASPGGTTAAGLPAPRSCGPSCAGALSQAGVAHAHARTRIRVQARANRTGARPAPSPSASAHPASARPATSASASTPSSPGGQQGAPAAAVLALINQARASAGLPPLTVTAGLDASASAHNLRMADGCGLTHQCPGEPAIGARETAAGVNWTAAGENIGEGGPEPDTTAAMTQMAVTLTQDMLNEKPPDDGHRLNILSSTFTHIGIAVDRDSSGTVWLTQDFSN